MKLYREAGINPLGCFSSMLIQMPILIALYQTFSIAIGETPEALISLSKRLYDFEYLRSGMPLPANFLWMHLGRPDPFILPLLVAVSTYVLQKMTMMPATDERTRAQNSMMNMMMPLIFGWITTTLPSGLGLYYALSNIVGMVMQYLYVGGGPFNWRALLGLSQDAVLPRALVVRENQTRRIRDIGRSNDDEDDDDRLEPGTATVPVGPGPRPPGGGSNARRRRRNNGGRGRNRR
jgi:YidC/Oxa1 family membrane protein insertase